MTKLQHLEDIQDLDIKSLREIADESHRKVYYEKYLKFEGDLIEKRIAPSFPAWILYEHHFNNQTIQSLAEEVGVDAGSISFLMKKMRIPKKNKSESRLGKSLSESCKSAISASLSGRDRSEEHRRALSVALSGENHPNYGKHLSEEHRKAISKGMIGNCPWEGRPLPEEMKLKIAKTLFENPNKSNNARKGGLVGGSKKVETTKLNAYHIENRFYAFSQQEGAVALLLEKYLPAYIAKDGISCQIRDRGIKKGGIDFLVDNEFLEWHPIILANGRRKDIPSKEEYESYNKVLESLTEIERAAFNQDYKQVLAVNYRNSRQEAVDNSEYAGANVALATNVQELYNFISKYSDKLPSYEQFKKEFKDKIKYVKGFKVKQETKALQKQEAA